MTNQKNKDSDISGVLIGCGIFTFALIILDATYSQFSAMIGTYYGKFTMIVHLAVVVLWGVVILHFNDPNYDKYRKWLIGVTLLALLLVIGHRSGFVDKKMFQEDVDKNKMEQSE